MRIRRQFITLHIRMILSRIAIFCNKKGAIIKEELSAKATAFADNH